MPRRWLSGDPLAAAADPRASLHGLLRTFGHRSFDGEQKVGAQLARLSRRDPRWRCLSVVPAGINGAHVDHLVIGPGGVFTIDTRSHPGGRIWVQGNAFRVNGAAYPYVSNSRHEALRASRYLSAACGFGVEVAGIVALAGAEEIAIDEPASDVHVLNHTVLRSWLRRREQVLDAPTLVAVYDAARRAATWNPPS